ncbi:hypothetical protein SESBI_28594 [Sesbania bispinosa]|nr:hypothetical protein SESBI_28594 [Sesbania bispinosa]
MQQQPSRGKIAQNRGTKTQQQLKTEERATAARVYATTTKLEKTRQKLQNPCNRKKKQKLHCRTRAEQQQEDEEEAAGRRRAQIAQ